MIIPTHPLPMYHIIYIFFPILTVIPPSNPTSKHYPKAHRNFIVLNMMRIITASYIQPHSLVNRTHVSHNTLFSLPLLPNLNHKNYFTIIKKIKKKAKAKKAGQLSYFFVPSRTSPHPFAYFVCKSKVAGYIDDQN
jgi:hypothetical protein